MSSDTLLSFLEELPLILSAKHIDSIADQCVVQELTADTILGKASLYSMEKIKVLLRYSFMAWHNKNFRLQV